MKGKKIVSILTVGLLLMMISACGKGEVGHVKADSDTETIYVSAAASMTDSMTELIDIYQKANPHIEIISNYASSGSLQRQIEQGAPTDVFISAALSKMENLEEEGLVESEYVELLKNDMVLIVPVSKNEITSIKALENMNALIFAMGEPESVPAGNYAKQVLESYDMNSIMESNTVFAKDVKEVLTWVSLEEADAGLVYSTDAKVDDRVKVVEVLADDTHEVIIYPAAVMSSSENKEEARAFLDFLKSESAMTVFERYGFSRVEE